MAARSLCTQTGGTGEGTGERAGPCRRRDGERDGLGMDAERGGCYGEQDTKGMDMERMLDGNFKGVIYFYLSNLIYVICWRCS